MIDSIISIKIVPGEKAPYPLVLNKAEIRFVKNLIFTIQLNQESVKQAVRPSEKNR